MRTTQPVVAHGGTFGIAVLSCALIPALVKAQSWPSGSTGQTSPASLPPPSPETSPSYDWAQPTGESSPAVLPPAPGTSPSYDWTPPTGESSPAVLPPASETSPSYDWAPPTGDSSPAVLPPASETSPSYDWSPPTGESSPAVLPPSPETSPSDDWTPPTGTPPPPEAASTAPTSGWLPPADDSPWDATPPEDLSSPAVTQPPAEQGAPSENSSSSPAWMPSPQLSPPVAQDPSVSPWDASPDAPPLPESPAVLTPPGSAPAELGPAAQGPWEGPTPGSGLPAAPQPAAPVATPPRGGFAPSTDDSGAPTLDGSGPDSIEPGDGPSDSTSPWGQAPATDPVGPVATSEAPTTVPATGPVEPVATSQAPATVPATGPVEPVATSQAPATVPATDPVGPVATSQAPAGAQPASSPAEGLGTTGPATGTSPGSTEVGTSGSPGAAPAAADQAVAVAATATEFWSALESGAAYVQAVQHLDLSDAPPIVVGVGTRAIVGSCDGPAPTPQGVPLLGLRAQQCVLITSAETLFIINATQTDAPAAAGRKLLAPGATPRGRGQRLWMDNIYMRRDGPSQGQGSSAPATPDLVRTGNGADVYMTSVSMQGSGNSDASGVSIGASESSTNGESDRVLISDGEIANMKSAAVGPGVDTKGSVSIENSEVKSVDAGAKGGAITLNGANAAARLDNVAFTDVYEYPVVSNADPSPTVLPGNGADQATTGSVPVYSSNPEDEGTRVRDSSGNLVPPLPLDAAPKGLFLSRNDKWLRDTQKEFAEGKSRSTGTAALQDASAPDSDALLTGPVESSSGPCIRRACLMLMAVISVLCL